MTLLHRARGALLFVSLIATLALSGPPPEAAGVAAQDAASAAWRPFGVNLWDARNAYESAGSSLFYYDNFKDYDREYYTTPQLGFTYSSSFLDPEEGDGFYGGEASVYLAFPLSGKLTPYLSYQHFSADDGGLTSQRVTTDWDLESNSVQAGFDYRCTNLDLKLGFEVGYGRHESDIGISSVGNFGMGRVRSDSYQIGGRISREIVFKGAPEGEELRHFRNNLVFEPFAALSGTLFNTDRVEIRGSNSNNIDFDDADSFGIGAGLVTRTRGRCLITDLILENFYYVKLSRYCGSDVSVRATSGATVYQQDVDTGGTAFSAGTGYTYKLSPRSELQLGYHFKHLNADESGADLNDHRLQFSYKIGF